MNEEPAQSVNAPEATDTPVLPFDNVPRTLDDYGNKLRGEGRPIDSYTAEQKYAMASPDARDIMRHDEVMKQLLALRNAFDENNSLLRQILMNLGRR